MKTLLVIAYILILNPFTALSQRVSWYNTITNESINSIDILTPEVTAKINVLQPDSLYIDVDCDINNLGDLIKISSLNKIAIFYNSLNNIDALKDLKGLNSLTLYSCNIKNLDALKDLSGLNSLTLFYCSKLKTIDALKSLKKLTALSLIKCWEIEDLEETLS
ncbi:MAG: hypothetical protein ACEQSR_04615, partial [Candidatus Methylacidiphilales bacterium]